MANFTVTGSGIVDLRATSMAGFDGLTFGTSGNATAQLSSTQFGAGVLPAASSIVGNTLFADQIEIFVAAGTAFSAASFVFTDWSTAGGDGLQLRDTAAANENITGSSENDAIYVSGGVDTVDGGAGSNDLLVIDWSADASTFQTSGSAFTDFINTQVIFSNIERFDIKLGSGSDNIATLGGNDVIDGGAGNDTLNTGAGEAIVNGGAGDLDRWGANLSAFVTGFSANLNTAGLQNIGNNSSLVNVEAFAGLTGSGASDTFISKTTAGVNDVNDTIDGGGGDDTIGVGGGVDTVDGGAGSNDLLVIDWSADTSPFQTSGNAFTDFINTQVSFSNIERFDIKLGSGADTLTLLGGNDKIDGGGGNDNLNTGAGAAIVDGGTGDLDRWGANLSAFGSGFSANLNTASLQNIGNNSSLVNVEGFASLVGSGVSDTFISKTTAGVNDVNDTIDGGSGDDAIGVGGGVDTVDGGAGSNDLLIVDWSADANSFTNSGSVFTDFVNTQVSFSNIERFDIKLGSGADTLTLLGGNDKIDGGGGTDVIDGGAGTDTMAGGLGNDTYFDNTGDTITEGAAAGYDTVNTTRASYTLGANVERVNFVGAGNFIGTGNSLASRFQGGAGDDRFVDVLGGADIFSGNAGTDTVDFRASVTGAVIDLTTGVHTGAAAGDSYSGIEKFLGSNTADDTMTGGGIGRWVFAGSGGNDTLTGGIKNDQLLGESGNDTLVGGADRDALDGGTGNDTMTGGTQGDVFTFIDAAFGQDTITDYQDGIDSFKVFSAVADDISDFTITNNGTTSVSLTLSAAPANTITINGALPINITTADFVFF